MAYSHHLSQHSYQDFLQLWTSLEELSPDNSYPTLTTEADTEHNLLGSSLEDLHSELTTEDIPCEPVSTINSSPTSQIAGQISTVTSPLPSSPPHTATTPSCPGQTSPQIVTSPSGEQVYAKHSTPSNTNYPGTYGFQVSFSPPQKETKSTSWTYSALGRKLYVKMASSCPVQFHTSQPPPEGSIIRAMAVFSKAEHAQGVVTRCPNHVSSREHNQNHPAPSHLVRCEHQLSHYLDDPSTGRHSVLTPYQQPQAGCPHLTYLYQFMCLGSCVGGPNRRPMQIVFTLENDQLVLGRAAVDIRICACPARDKRLEEKSYLPKPPASSPSYTTGDKPRAAHKRKLDTTDTFTITIHGRDNFEILRKIRDSLELMSSLSNDQVTQYKQCKVSKSCTQLLQHDLSTEFFSLPQIIPPLQMVQ
ncbi:tumor protein p73-like [Liolophura sinensis]|uniref:tumor protein p73-like n=1 Tax=Liolophura sinensis TaxID=3198878 RepID=UPI003158AFEE